MVIPTFFAKLPPGHEIRSSSVAALKRRISQSDRAKGSFNSALATELKEVAASLLWLEDVNVVIDAPALTALHSSQRATLCKVCAVPLSSNVVVVVNRLLAALGVGAEQDKDAHPPPPSDSFLALIKDSLKDDHGELVGASMDTCRAILADTPFGPAATGSSASGLAKAREACAMLRWCYAALHSADDFAIISAEQVRMLVSKLGLMAVPANQRNDAVLARITKWRSDLVPGADDSPKQDAGMSGGKGLADQIRFASLSSPDPPSARMMASGATRPWWVHRLNFVPDVFTGTQNPAEHNILMPNGLGASATPGSSVWAVTRGASAGCLEAIINEHGGAHADELATFIPLVASLHVDAVQLIADHEKTQLIASRKAEDSHRRMAIPSLASWPWLQDLDVSLAKSTDAYDLGRMLSVALRVDNDQFNDPLDQLARKARIEAREKLAAAFQCAQEAGNLAAVLLALEAVQHLCTRELDTAYAHAHARLGKFPTCPFIVEITAGRDIQRGRVETFMKAFRKAVEQGVARKPEGEREQYMAGAYFRFFEGFNSAAIASVEVDSRYMAAGRGFAAAAGGGSSGSGSAGGVGYGGSAAGGAAWGSPGSGGSGFGGPGGAAGRGRGTPTGQARNQTTLQSRQQQQHQQQQQQQQRGCHFGVHIPCSKAVVGTELGVEGPGPTFVCWGCKQRAGHYKGECPEAWGKKGKPLPGYDKDGVRTTKGWHDDVPRKRTYVKWVEFLKDTDNYPAGGAVPANVQDAPELAAFEERAINARA